MTEDLVTSDVFLLFPVSFVCLVCVWFGSFVQIFLFPFTFFFSVFLSLSLFYITIPSFLSIFSLFSFRCNAILFKCECVYVCVFFSHFSVACT